MAKMDGNGWLTLFCVGVLVLQPQACRDEVAAHKLANNEVVEPFLNDFAQNTVATRLETMSMYSQDLVAALEDSVEDITDEVLFENAQEAWFTTTQHWQEIEVMQVASLGSSLSTTGGKDVRDDVYSWPLSNPCRIDQVMASGAYQSSDFFETALVSVIGLDAMEYLLFAPLDTECPSQVPPISDGSWATFSDEDIRQRRLEYALVLARQVNMVVDAEVIEWSEGFPQDLYTSPAKAVNAVFNALLYTEEYIKERKIQHPLGLKEDCSVDCHLDVEGLYSAVSTEFLMANFQGVLAVLKGETAGGLNQILIEMGESELATELESLVMEVIVELEAIETPMSVVMEENPSAFDNVQTKIGDLTTLLKWDVATVLEMEIPQQSAGDND